MDNEIVDRADVVIVFDVQDVDRAQSLLQRWLKPQAGQLPAALAVVEAMPPCRPA